MTIAGAGSAARRIADARRSETRALRHRVRRVGLDAVIGPRRLLGHGSSPDFVIAGAQRSGTTSLFDTLRKHPQVAPLILDIKGVHYFDTDGDRPLSWYRAHFPTERQRAEAARAGLPIVAGEASPYYMFHPTALPRLREAEPEAKVLILLRHPVDRTVSHYRHMVWEGHEDLPTLAEALEAEDRRLDGQAARLAADPGALSAPHQHHSYAARSMYVHQVRAAQQLFGDRLEILISEELFASPAEGLARVCRFLGIEERSDLLLPQSNSTPGDALDEDTLARLHERFDPEIAELESLLGRSLPWRRRRAA